MPTDHSGDQQAAPLRTVAERLDEVREGMRQYINALDDVGPVNFALAGVEALCDVLLPLSATVERLEAAEKAKAGVWGPCGFCGGDHLTGHRENCALLAGRGERGADRITADASAVPVPPSPSAARLQVGDYAFERTNRTSSGWRIMESTRLADLEGPVGPVLAAALEELARLRARLGKGVRGEVGEWQSIRSVYAKQFHGFRNWPTGTLVLVLPDEPEGLTTDSQNPEPGRGTK